MVIELAWDAAKDAVIARAITIATSLDRFGNIATQGSTIASNIGFVAIGQGSADDNTVAANGSVVNPTNWQVAAHDHPRLVVNHLIIDATYIFIQS